MHQITEISNANMRYSESLIVGPTVARSEDKDSMIFPNSGDVYHGLNVKRLQEIFELMSRGYLSPVVLSPSLLPLDP